MQRRTAIYARGINDLDKRLNIKNHSAYDQKNGLEAQIRALRVFCEQNKIEEYELFADENQSGTKASRPGLDRMMKAVES
jgi:DNA invertase Pin-like site-specific DNA recombinase